MCTNCIGDIPFTESILSLDVKLEFWGGQTRDWPQPLGEENSMDCAMAEIINYLDGDAPFPDLAEESLHTLEVIVACHASHRRSSTWTTLPLTGTDRQIEVQSG